jgi:transposase
LLVVIQRFIEPSSKFATYQQKDKIEGAYSVDLQHLYRSLDLLSEHKAKIEDSLFDTNGFLGILTNNHDLQGETLIEKYKELWRIEESFRLMKSQLEVRPMFHWTEKRISGHLVMCFLAFVFMRELERRTKKYGIEESINKMLKALSELQVSELDSKGECYFLRSHVPPLAERIFEALKLKLPPSFLPIISKDEARNEVIDFS